jgi:hypothetical protein
MPNWRSLLAIGDQWLGGIEGERAQPGSGAILIYFRWLLLHNILGARLTESYDRFVITRSDFVWNVPHPPLSILSDNHVWIPRGEFYGGLTDRHIVASREDIGSVLNLIDDIVVRPQALYKLMSRRADWNLEKYILFHFERSGLADRVRLFPYVSYTVRGEKDGTRWKAGTYDPERGMIVKYPTELISARLFEGRIAAKDDWEILAQTRPQSFAKLGGRS